LAAPCLARGLACKYSVFDFHLMTTMTTTGDHVRPLSAADLRPGILDAVRREPAPPRPVESRRRILLVAFGFASAGAIAIVKRGFDRAIDPPLPTGSGRRLWHVVTEGGAAAQDRPLGYVVTLELIWLLVAGWATWVGMARGRSMLGRSSASKIAVATLTPAALILTWLVVAFAWIRAVLPLAWVEVMNDGPDGHFHTCCALMSLAYAAGPLLAFLAIRRGRDLASPIQAGAAIGAAAGAWGAVVHFPFCQCTSPLHVALGHVLPVVVLATLGALVGGPLLGVHTPTMRSARPAVD
jgi:hypothetical protein